MLVLGGPAELSLGSSLRLHCWCQDVPPTCPHWFRRVLQCPRLSGQTTFRGSVKLHLLPKACNTSIAIIMFCLSSVGSNRSVYCIS